MGIPNEFFTGDWTTQGKKWAELQLSFLPPEVQKEIIRQFSVQLQIKERKPKFEKAFGVALPGPDKKWGEVYESATGVESAQWLLITRFFSDDPIAMTPRLYNLASNLPTGLPGTERAVEVHTQDGKTYVGVIMNETPQALTLDVSGRFETLAKATITSRVTKTSLGGLVNFFAKAGVSQESMTQLTEAVEYVMQVSRQEVSEGQKVGGTRERVVKPKSNVARRRLLYHQTGLDKPDDPYISTSCVLPCLVETTCKTVTTIMRETRYLGFFLIPRSRFRVLWLKNMDEYDKLVWTKGKGTNRDKWRQVEQSWKKMLDEREIAYTFPPPLNVYQVCRVDNPLRKT